MAPCMVLMICNTFFWSTLSGKCDDVHVDGPTMHDYFAMPEVPWQSFNIADGASDLQVLESMCEDDFETPCIVPVSSASEGMHDMPTDEGKRRRIVGKQPVPEVVHDPVAIAAATALVKKTKRQKKNSAGKKR